VFVTERAPALPDVDRRDEACSLVDTLAARQILLNVLQPFIEDACGLGA
jgi:hypothetical protein